MKRDQDESQVDSGTTQRSACQACRFFKGEVKRIAPASPFGPQGQRIRRYCHTGRDTRAGNQSLRQRLCGGRRNVLQQERLTDAAADTCAHMVAANACAPDVRVIPAIRIIRTPARPASPRLLPRPRRAPHRSAAHRRRARRGRSQRSGAGPGWPSSAPPPVSTMPVLAISVTSSAGALSSAVFTAPIT